MRQKKLARILTLIMLVMLIGVVYVGPIGVSAANEGSAWKPTRAINVIIQYAAGGGTDLTLRMLAANMEKSIGTSIACVNMPGATGSVATDYVWNARRDGYTWLGAATNDVIHYPVMGFHHTTYKDWRYFLGTLSTTIVCVSSDSKYKTMDDLLKDFREKPGKVKIATAGIGASGHVAAEILHIGAGIEYRHVPYTGGYPAIVATMGQECEVVLQHAIEVVDMVRAKQLRPLAVYDTKPLDLPGHGSIPAITDWLPELTPYIPHGAHFGIVLPKDTPANILDAVEVAFKEALETEDMKEFAATRGIDLIGLTGDEAEKWLGDQANVVTWILYDAGLAKNNPADFGFKKLW